MDKADRKRRKRAPPGAGQKPPVTTPANLDSRRKVMGICVALAALTLAVFGQTLRHEFINFDDDHYVYENPMVTAGLTQKGIASAFLHGSAENWDPVTTLSHMADCQVYGLNAGGHHLTNVVLHTGSVLLLFLVLRRMTGALWRSALVAAVFAVHPLHVESVAWVSERKDVLSGLFFMLTLWAYARYARRPFSLGGYLLVAGFLALGLMSKAMLVTTPLVLLLLDYWPLKRIGGGSRPAGAKIPKRVILEKLPLLAMSAGSCAAAVWAQGKAIRPLDEIPFSLRLCNAAVSYVIYLRQTIWPAGLAPYYPYPSHGLPMEEVLAAILLLGAASATALVSWRRRPYLLAGWLWYLGMLVPVIGLVQVAQQSHADRYTYLPQIGLTVAVIWLAADLCAGWRKSALVAVAAVVMAALTAGAYVQTGNWKDSKTLWQHTLACTRNNPLAYNNLGNAFLNQGRVQEAIVQYQKAVETDPGGAMFHDYLGNALLQKNRTDEAIVQFQQAIEIEPDKAVFHNNLGNALLQKRRVDEAIAHFQKAVELKPDKAVFHNGAVFQNNLGNAFIQKEAVDEAIVHYQKAVEIEPANAVFHYNLANAFIRKGWLDEAIQHYQRTVEIEPNSANAHNNLGSALLQKREVDKAIVHFQRAVEIEPDNALFHTNFNNALLQRRPE